MASAVPPSGQQDSWALAPEGSSFLSLTVAIKRLTHISAVGGLFLRLYTSNWLRLVRAYLGIVYRRISVNFRHCGISIIYVIICSAHGLVLSSEAPNIRIGLMERNAKSPFMSASKVSEVQIPVEKDFFVSCPTEKPLGLWGTSINGFPCAVDNHGEYGGRFFLGSRRLRWNLVPRPEEFPPRAIKFIFAYVKDFFVAQQNRFNLEINCVRTRFPGIPQGIMHINARCLEIILRGGHLGKDSNDRLCGFNLSFGLLNYC